MVSSGREVTAQGFGPAYAASPAGSSPAPVAASARAMGFVTEEQGVRPMPDERREGFDVAERAARMAEFPRAAAAGPEIFTDDDERFEDGLLLIVAGIEARYGVR